MPECLCAYVPVCLSAKVRLRSLRAGIKWRGALRHAQGFSAGDKPPRYFPGSRGFGASGLRLLARLTVGIVHALHEGLGEGVDDDEEHDLSEQSPFHGDLLVLATPRYYGTISVPTPRSV